MYVIPLPSWALVMVAWRAVVARVKLELGTGGSPRPRATIAPPHRPIRPDMAESKFASKRAVAMLEYVGVSPKARAEGNAKVQALFSQAGPGKKSAVAWETLRLTDGGWELGVSQDLDLCGGLRLVRPELRERLGRWRGGEGGL